MKVICIDNKGVEAELTIGKVYEVLNGIGGQLSTYDNMYKIVDDGYYKRRFKPYNPINKLKALINDGDK